MPSKTPGSPVRALTSLVTLPAVDVTVVAYRVWDEAAGLLTLVVRRVRWWSLVRSRRPAAG
ncbi:hypothetical protein [Micromonospora saelicesensis]|uniref:hypothetical protein n=1 Tax=Micromonospora saelicesensis TaxID=285676 RepID=UPI00114CD853|nr:hypothetical protein [Micromonospora saelicesensis]